MEKDTLHLSEKELNELYKERNINLKERFQIKNFWERAIKSWGFPDVETVYKDGKPDYYKSKLEPLNRHGFYSDAEVNLFNALYHLVKKGETSKFIDVEKLLKTVSIVNTLLEIESEYKF